MDNKSSPIKYMQFNIDWRFVSLWSGYFDELNFHVLWVLVKKKKQGVTISGSLLLGGGVEKTQQFTQENFSSYILKYFK